MLPLSKGSKMPKSAIEMEDADTDVTRQAELVVMDCLKSWNCPRALDAFMEKSSASRVSAIASERFSNDMEAKKKISDVRISLLEYMLSTTSDSNDTPTSSSQRGSSSTTKDAEADVGLEWTKEEVSTLKKAIKKTSAVEDKNTRWKQIAGLVGNGKTKKHCYLKYKDLKQEQTNAARKASPRRKRLSEDKSKRESDEAQHVDSKPDAELDMNDNATDNGKADTDDSSFKPKSSEEITMTAFVVSNRTAAPEMKSANTSFEALEVEDCEDMGMLLDQPTTGLQSSRPSCNIGPKFVAGTTRIPTASDVTAVQQLLFGATRKAFSSHWDEQGFVFSTVRDLQYGLVQYQGGPCGILAVVQGYVLRFLLQHAPVDWKNAGAPYQERALVQALAHIIWRTARVSRGSGNAAIECFVAVKDSNAGGQRRFMAGLKLHVATSEEQARQIVTAHLTQFMEPKGSGLVQFVLSVLLTKGVDTIKSEMDQLAGDSGGQLIGAHDYCTQEIVNLLLCGYARSNVFDGDQILEGTNASGPDALVLRGISSQSEIGFLSLFEAYQNLIVGSHLKQPRVNIWVVCSESHYSVLFVAEPRSLEDRAWETRPRVDLLYYDGLANQDEEIQLTVDTLAVEQHTIASYDDLIPPLNLVLRTKWPRATVDWNGVDPLL